MFHGHECYISDVLWRLEGRVPRYRVPRYRLTESEARTCLLGSLLGQLDRLGSRDQEDLAQLQSRENYLACNGWLNKAWRILAEHEGHLWILYKHDFSWYLYCAPREPFLSAWAKNSWSRRPKMDWPCLSSASVAD